MRRADPTALRQLSRTGTRDHAHFRRLEALDLRVGQEMLGTLQLPTSCRALSISSTPFSKLRCQVLLS